MEIGKNAGIVGEITWHGGEVYIYNCYNRGNCPNIIGYDNHEGICINLNNYGADATVDKLNVESDIEQGLKDTKLYRSNAWISKDGQVALDWEK